MLRMEEGKREEEEENMKVWWTSKVEVKSSTILLYYEPPNFGPVGGGLSLMTYQARSLCMPHGDRSQIAPR